jgi:DNA polymerase-3 subunit beta
MIETDISIGSDCTVTCKRDDLVAALTTVTRAVSSRGSVQVLGGVLLQPVEGGVQLAGTDMELSLRTVIPANVDGDGAIAIPGRLLSDLARLLPSESATIAHKAVEGSAHITSGAYSSRVNIFAADDFPRLPSVDVALHDVEAASLVSTIERVSRSASKDESRPVLTGILVRFEGDTLVMAATDSYRLSVKETKLSAPGPELEAIIPARALGELTRLAGSAETVRLGVNDNHVVFGAGDVWLTSRRIDGQFPNYKQLIPETYEVEVELPRGELLDVVRRAAVLAQRNTPLRLRFSEGELTISAQSQDVGETRETMPAPYQGDPLEIGFNADFLREGLESVQGDTVLVRLINPLRPGLLSAAGDTFSYLIMPIRLAG